MVELDKKLELSHSWIENRRVKPTLFRLSLGPNGVEQPKKGWCQTAAHQPFFGCFPQKLEVIELDKKLELFDSGVEYRFIVAVDGTDFQNPHDSGEPYTDEFDRTIGDRDTGVTRN